MGGDEYVEEDESAADKQRLLGGESERHEAGVWGEEEGRLVILEERVTCTCNLLT